MKIVTLHFVPVLASGKKRGLFVSNPEYFLVIQKIKSKVVFLEVVTVIFILLFGTSTV